MLDAVEKYAKAIGASDEVLDWCRTTLRKVLSTRMFYPSMSEVEHIIDWLVSDAAPSRLRRMSYDQALAGSDKWMKANLKKGRGLTDTESDIETMHDFLDGTRIVKLLSSRAYEREGFFMKHCVAGYNPSTSTIYSYRDARNEPHATFEVARNGKEIVQIKGKGNGSIHPRYIHPILAFLQIVGMPVRPRDMANLGYIHVPDKVIDIVAMFCDSTTQFHTFYGEKYLQSSEVR